MSKIDEYITKRSQQNPNFARKYKEENQRLQVMCNKKVGQN